VTSYTPLPPTTPSSASSPSLAPLVDGPRWYRTRIRLWGPFLALIVPAVVGAIASAALSWSDAAWSGAVGLIAGVMAAPVLLMVGAPFGDSDLYPYAIAGSVLLWMLIGVVASRRATRNPMATWRDYWRHYAWLCGGVWVGCIAALGIAGAVISDSLF
jgi:hypothetical protein